MLVTGTCTLLCAIWATCNVLAIVVTFGLTALSGFILGNLGYFCIISATCLTAPPPRYKGRPSTVFWCDRCGSVHLWVCLPKWSDVRQVHTTLFSSRGKYACRASNCRFSCKLYLNYRTLFWLFLDYLHFRGQLSLLPSAGREISSSYGYAVKA